jgi:short-subunit dehydrogenase
MMKLKTTLITGASSGIGMHLAREFAAHGHPLVLVAPVTGELESLANELSSTHGVDVRIIAKDLELPNAAQEIFDELDADGVTIDILVNNAGHGLRGLWWEHPIEEDLSMIRLNIVAPLRLTKLFLPPMVERGEGRILVTASVAGFEPGPLLNTYHSTKAFILSWTEALASELEGTGVTATALCPGPTDTDFFPKAGMLATNAFQKAKVMAPQDVARIGYEGLMKNEVVVIPGIANKALVAARRVLSEGMQAGLNKKLYETSDRQDRERGDVETASEENRLAGKGS